MAARFQTSTPPRPAPSPAPSNAQLFTTPRVRNSTCLQPADAARSGRINPSSAHRVLASIAFVPRAQFPNRLLIAPAFSSQRPGGTWAHGDYPGRAIGQIVNCRVNCRCSIGCFIKAFHEIAGLRHPGVLPHRCPAGEVGSALGVPLGRAGLQIYPPPSLSSLSPTLDSVTALSLRHTDCLRTIQHPGFLSLASTTPTAILIPYSINH